MLHKPSFFRALIPVLAILAARADAQNIKPMNDRVDAIVAHPLVLPILVESPKSIDDHLRVRLDDGRDVQSRAFYIWASTATTDHGWTKSTPIWNLIDPDQYIKSPPTTAGTWIAMIDLPIDAVGQGIWIDKVRYEPNWLPSPARVILETSSRASDGFWNPALSESDHQSPLVLDAISNLRADPFNHWRASLMTEGFMPDANTGTNPVKSDRDLIAIHTELLQTDSSLAMDQIADHFAARWQIILGRLWLIDPAVANQLKHQLTRTAWSGGTLVPLWTDDTTELTALAHDLLSPFVNDELRVERVAAWLGSQPNSMSWIIDDSGHPSRNPVGLAPSIGLLGLKPHSNNEPPQLARIQTQGTEPQVQLLPAATMTQITIQTPATISTNYAQTREPREIYTKIGHRRATLKAIGDIPLAAPPGVLVGPLLSDWTLQAFNSRISGLGALPDLDKRVAGLLHRTSDILESDPRAGWRLYLECAIDPTANPEADTTVQIWVGPMGSTRASWTISRSLGLIETRSDPDINPDPALTTFTDGDRWIITLDIPQAAISDDGFLLIGLERTDADLHSSWPRRMMPWQAEPGRFTIDITGWTGTGLLP